MGLFTDLLSSIVPRRQSGKAEVIDLTGNQTYETEIVGELDYQDELEELCGPRLSDGVYQLESALLVVNEKAISNKNAVRVEIRGRLVGYLGLEDTIRYRRYLNAKGKPTARGRCQAVIQGGWVSSDGHKGPFYVALDLPPLDP